MWFILIWFSETEHLEASRVRLLSLLRVQRTLLKRFQIENHRILELERLETIESNTLILMASRDPETGSRPKKKI